MNDADALPLRRVNPIAKLGAALVYLLVMTALFDPRAQAVVLAVSVLALLALERIAPLRLLGVLAPFALMGLGLWGTNLLFPAQTQAYLDSLGRFSLLRNPAFDAGLVVFLRAVNFGAISYLFVHSTRPADLALGLMQKLRAPPALAFSVFSAVQFMPALAEDLRQLRLARRLRRAPGRRSWRESMGEPVRLMVPLLVSAMRRAQRAAISMEARGLASPMTRTYLRHSIFGVADAVFVACATAILAAAVAVAFVNL